MVNPVTPYEIRDASDVDALAAWLNQNFFALVDWATYNAIHTHHLWVNEYAVSALAAGASQDIPVTFSSGQFGPLANPKVTSVQPFSSQSTLTDNSDWVTSSVFNETSTGASVRVRNQSASALGSTVFIRVTVTDLNYDTTG